MLTDHWLADGALNSTLLLLLVDLARAPTPTGSTWSARAAFVPVVVDDWGRLVVTDRLHAHVLAGLMGVPHIVVDNSYGKVAAIHGEYTHGFLEGVFARDLDQSCRRLQPSNRRPRTTTSWWA